MRKIVLLEHLSLDGYLAGPNGEMDWIRIDDELWDYIGPLTDEADAAVFGRVTYEMMAGYWPTAADQPTATQHDVDHSAWLKKAARIVFSQTLTEAPWGSWGGSQVIARVDPGQIEALKQQPGKNLLLIGSVSLAREFIAQGLIDEYYLNVNPALLGGGKPLFPDAGTRQTLELVGSRTFRSGVVGLHYRAV